MWGTRSEGFSIQHPSLERSSEQEKSSCKTLSTKSSRGRVSSERAPLVFSAAPAVVGNTDFFTRRAAAAAAAGES